MIINSTIIEIDKDKFLKSLYMKNAKDFVNDLGIQKLTNTYLSKALYSTTFSRIHEMNAYSFLQFLLPLITTIYTFKFDKDKMIKSFKDKILIGSVKDIKFKNNKYEIKLEYLDVMESFNGTWKIEDNKLNVTIEGETITGDIIFSNKNKTLTITDIDSKVSTVLTKQE